MLLLFLEKGFEKTSAINGSFCHEKRKSIFEEGKNKIAEQEKIIDGLKFALRQRRIGGRDFEMQKKENGYLTEINELLRKK